MNKTKRKTGWWWETGHKSRVLWDIFGCRLPRRDVDEVTRCTNPELCDALKIWRAEAYRIYFVHGTKGYHPEKEG